MADPEENHYELKKTISELVQSGEKELNQIKMKRVKKICRSEDCYITEAHTLLMKHLRKKHSEVRYSAMQIVAELFQRSHQFRLLIVECLEEFLSLTMATDSEKPLPPPKARAKLLKKEALSTLKDWIGKYGEGYKKLKLTYEYLKNVKKVDFNDEQGGNEIDRLRAEQAKEKLNNIWKERVKRVKTEMEEEGTDIEDCLSQTNNSLRILIPTLDDFYLTQSKGDDSDIKIEARCSQIVQENDSINSGDNEEDCDYSSIPADVRENGLIGKAGGSVEVNLEGDVGENEFDSAMVEVVVDQYQVITKRKLPITKKWVTILTKAGEVTDQDLLKKSIDMKNQLEETIKKILSLGLDIENKLKKNKDDGDSTDDEDFVEVDDKSGYEFSAVDGNDLGISFTEMGPSTSKCRQPANPSNETTLKIGSTKHQETTWKIGSTKHQEQDPTTWAATFKKLTEKQKPCPTSLGDKPGAANSHARDLERQKKLRGEENERGNCCPRVPIVRLDEPAKVYVDTERAGSRFWVSSCRDGEEIVVPQSGGTTRVVEFTGKFEPVSWRCRAPLPSGRLCPRQDRVKCPLHGLVVARDNMGNPNGQDKYKVKQIREPQAWRDEDLQRDIEAATGQNLVLKKGRSKSRGLTDVKKEEDTSRNRLEKKVFNRSSMKRVANSLDKFDSKKFKDKFYDQFNSL